MTLTLGVENKNTDKPLDFTTALHTYIKYYTNYSKDWAPITKIVLRVPDVASASIKGLQGLKFVDKTVEGTPTLEEAREEVSWSACMPARHIHSIAMSSMS